MATKRSEGPSEGSTLTVEVTDAMIEAGAEALVKWEASSDPYSANCVVAVYRAMEAAKPR